MKKPNPVCENANRLLSAMKFLGERAKLALGPSKRSAMLLAMARCGEHLKHLATGKDPDPEVIHVWKEAVALQKAIKSSVASDTAGPIPLEPLQVAAQAITNIFSKFRELEAALAEDPKAADFSDLVQVGSLLAVVTTISAAANAELPKDLDNSMGSFEVFAVCSEISQAAGACQDLGAKLSALIGSRLK